MQFNKGMLSALRERKQNNADGRNSTDRFITMMNLYHSLDMNVKYNENERKKLKKELEHALLNMKSNLPSAFAANLKFWLGSREAWLSR